MPVPVQSPTRWEVLLRSAFGLPRWWWRKGYILTNLSMRNLIAPARAAYDVIRRKAREIKIHSRARLRNISQTAEKSWQKVERFFNDSQVSDKITFYIPLSHLSLTVYFYAIFLFHTHTARSVLLEFQAPMSSHTCLNIQQALSENLAFFNHLSGPCRLPYLSIFILGSYPEVSS